MRAAFGGLVLATALAADPAMAAPARTSAATSSTARLSPVQLWGGMGYYNVGGGGSSGSDFGFNGGGSYAVPINVDFSALGFGNLGLAFGDVFTLPITAGGGIRFDHLGPVQLSALLGFTVAPIGNSVGTKPGLGFGVMGNYPLRGQLPSLPNLGLQAQFMYHVLADSLHIWTLNFGVTYDLPY